MEEKKLRILVLCASRDNINGLYTVCGALSMLASGKNEIEYLSNGELLPSLGAVWNKMASLAKPDVYALVIDRALCITPNWDMVIAEAYNSDPKRVFWWTTNHGPVIPIVPYAWKEAAGQIFTDYFPFWFDDTWLHELSALVYGLPNYMIPATCCIRKKNPMTKRLRDLRFWMDFFIAKRPERIAHAAKIREKFGLPEPDMKPFEEWAGQETAKWDASWKIWEEVMGDKSEPDETYIAAKRRAEEFLNGNRD